MNQSFIDIASEYLQCLKEAHLLGIVDAELAEWVEVLKTVHMRKIQIVAFANNHYAGYGPDTIEQFRELWRRQVSAQTGKSRQGADQGQLFK